MITTYTQKSPEKNAQAGRKIPGAEAGLLFGGDHLIGLEQRKNYAWVFHLRAYSAAEEDSEFDSAVHALSLIS